MNIHAKYKDDSISTFSDAGYMTVSAQLTDPCGTATLSYIGDPLGATSYTYTIGDGQIDFPITVEDVISLDTNAECGEYEIIAYQLDASSHYTRGSLDYSMFDFKTTPAF